jgi:hypothetical protein
VLVDSEPGTLPDQARTMEWMWLLGGLGDSSGRCVRRLGAILLPELLQNLSLKFDTVSVQTSDRYLTDKTMLF